MFEHLYAEIAAGRPCEEPSRDGLRDVERMEMCERWRAAGAKPAERELWALRKAAELNGERLV